MIKETSITIDQTRLMMEVKSCESGFVKLIHDRLGIVVRHQMRDLPKIILKACQKFDYWPHELLSELSICSSDSPILKYLIASITIGETYFFRDQNQVNLLREYILPNLIQRKRTANDLSLRIWSAGCSSGEEIYTIAIMLSEILPDIKNWKLHLLGTDINTVVLQKAMTGIYSEWSMRSIKNRYKDCFFSKSGKDYILDSSIRNLVNFAYLNLKEDEYPSVFNETNAQDLIICRNVLIYFDNEVIEKLMKKISASLVSDGYLLLGASDPVILDDTNLVINPNKGMLFSKNSAEIVKKELNLAKNISVESIKLPVKKISSTVKIADHQKIAVSKSSQHEDITLLLKEAQWQKVIDSISQYEMTGKKSVFLLNSKATAYANLGDLKQAAKCCEESLLLDPTNKYTYFTYALTLAELDKLQESENALRKTLFLDHQFVVGHFQLGLLQFKRKQQAAGIKSLKNALQMAISEDASKIVPGSQGLSYGQFAELLKNEINIYAALEIDNYVNQ